MKNIIASLISIFLLMGGAGAALAAPFDCNNPHIVACYPTGDHGIVGEPSLHQGADVVLPTGRNGGFQQWFCGTGDNGGKDCDHSHWKISKDGTCPSTWILVPRPNPAWGGYLTPGVDYCVHNNDFGD